MLLALPRNPLDLQEKDYLGEHEKSITRLPYFVLSVLIESSVVELFDQVTTFMFFVFWELVARPYVRNFKNFTHPDTLLINSIDIQYAQICYCYTSCLLATNTLEALRRS